MISDGTIYALSSGSGRAGIAVIRVSGPDCERACVRLAGGRPAARKFVVRTLRDPVRGDVIDQAGVLWLPGPGSATGEDMCEFHVHGGRAVISALLRALGETEGLRLAVGGEFARRAFLNGKLDLVAVEGLGDLLDARSDSQRVLALSQMLGGASDRIETWRSRLIGALGRLDAALEFSDDEDVARISVGNVDDVIEGIAEEMRSALVAGERAESVRAGVSIVLAGLPNTGKSSLLNAIARRDAAIVSPIAGTTRDVIEVQVDLDGVAVVVSDTAGLRHEIGDDIEGLGIGRTRQRLKSADLVVWVASNDVEGSEVVESEIVPSIRVQNKCDLRFCTSSGRSLARHSGDVLLVSAQTGDGLAELLSRLGDLAKNLVGRVEDIVVVRERQRQALTESIRHLNDCVLRDARLVELKVADLRFAANALGRITGRIDVEDWLDSIFREFCIGK